MEAEAGKLSQVLSGELELGLGLHGRESCFLIEGAGSPSILSHGLRLVIKPLSTLRLVTFD